MNNQTMQQQDKSNMQHNAAQHQQENAPGMQGVAQNAAPQMYMGGSPVYNPHQQFQQQNQMNPQQLNIRGPGQQIYQPQVEPKQQDIRQINLDQVANTFSLGDIQQAQQEQLNIQAQESQLMRLLQEENLDNLSADQIQALHRLAMQDQQDFKLLEEMVSNQNVQNHDFKAEEEEQLRQMQAQLMNLHNQTQMDQGGNNHSQSHVNQLGQEKPRLQMIQGMDHQLDTAQLQIDEKLLECLQNQQISHEQQQQLAAQGIDLHTLEMAGVQIHDKDALTEQELMAQLQSLQAQQQNKMTEEEIVLLHQEFMRQNPNLSLQEVSDIIQQKYLEPIQQNTYQLNPQGQITGENLNPETEGQIVPQQENSAQLPQGYRRLEGNMSEHDINNDEPNEEEKLRDMYFEQQLRIFFKNMMERLPNSIMEKISKRSKQFCEEINKAQLDHVQRAKQRKAWESNLQSEANSAFEPGEENDANSSFYSVLYGETSKLDPDPFISDMLGCLNNHSDLKKQFKRFLPESEEEIQEMEKNVQKLKQSINTGIDDVPMGTELDHSHEELSTIHKLKRDAFQNLFKLLEEYSETKESCKTFVSQSKQTQINEALQLLSQKIMKIAENYQKYVKDDIRMQIEANKNKKETKHYLEFLENQMSMILSVIPQEIIDSYNVKTSIKGGLCGTGKETDQNKKADKGPKTGRRSMRPLSSEEPSEESNQEVVDEDMDEEFEGEMESEGSQDGEEVEEEEEEEIEEQQSPVKEQEEIRQVDQIQYDHTQIVKLKNLLNELSMHFPGKLKDLSKTELKVFDNLHRTIRNEADWLEFTKLFMLYIDGIISINDMFRLFEEKFGHRINEELMKDIEQLFPTRDHNRRLNSEILKPWNDLENQKFHKIDESSYYKLEPNFPLPMCTAKLDPKNQGQYAQFLNERYLSLSMGSENFKFKVRNANEDAIFKNEDDMYKLDTQIEMFEKCESIIDSEIMRYDEVKKAQKFYEFPCDRLKPMMFFWERRYKDALLPILLHKPFKKEFLIVLKQGLQAKLQELQNLKLDSQSYFEDVYRKNFAKSLDHRSFMYKDFIKKYLQKQTHTSLVKQVAASNTNREIRSLNLLRGGSSAESPFYHSFGGFQQHVFQSQDLQPTNDFPMNMAYKDFKAKSFLQTEKLPHHRFIMSDQLSMSIVVKILCLNIRYSALHHQNDRPRLTENLRQILQDFLKVHNFKKLNAQCGIGHIEGLNQKQVDVIMNQDSQQYYKKRSGQPRGYGDIGGEDQAQIKVQIFQVDTEVFSSPKKSQIIAPVQEQTSELKLQTSNAKDTETEKEEAQSLTKVDHQTPEPMEQQSKGQTLTCEKMKMECVDSMSMDEHTLLPHFKKGYNLLYAPHNIFMFLKFFYAIYERILRSKDLVQEKIIQDLSEIPMAERKLAGICNENGETKKELLEAFYHERMEYFLKGIFAITAQNSSSSILGVGSLSSLNQQPHNVLDSSKYEDYARVLLGKNAFLLFNIDKLITQALKQLQSMHSDTQCQRAVRMFKDTAQAADTGKEELCESKYLAYYVQQVMEQLPTGDITNASKCQKKTEDDCKHSSQKYIDSRNSLDRENRQWKTDNQSGQSSSYLAQLGQNNFQVYRLMYSQVSKVMSIHFLNLNPYQLPIQAVRGKMRDNMQVLKELITNPGAPSLTYLAPPTCDCTPNTLSDDQTQPPIFLKRNLKSMLKHRNSALPAGQNGLCMEVVPMLNRMNFYKGEDVYVYARKRKTQLFTEEKKKMVVWDLERTVAQNDIVLKRIKTQEN